MYCVKRNSLCLMYAWNMRHSFHGQTQSLPMKTVPYISGEQRRLTRRTFESTQPKTIPFCIPRLQTPFKKALIGLSAQMLRLTGKSVCTCLFACLGPTAWNITPSSPDPRHPGNWNAKTNICPWNFFTVLTKNGTVVYEQTVYPQIKLLLKEQFDQDLHRLLFHEHF